MQKVDHFDSKIQWKSILKTIAGYELSNDVCDELWTGMHNIIEGKIKKSLYEDIKKEIQRDLQTEATTVQKPVDNHCVSTDKLYTNTAIMLKKYNIVI